MDPKILEQTSVYLNLLDSTEFLGKPAIGLFQFTEELPPTSKSLSVIIKQNNLLITQLIWLQKKMDTLTEEVKVLQKQHNQVDPKVTSSLDLITQKIGNLKISDSENVIKPQSRLLYVYKKPSSSKGKEVVST